MSRTVCAVSEAKSKAPATGLVTVPTSPLPRPEKKPLTPPSVLIPSTVEVMILVMPPMIPKEGEHFLKRHENQQGCYLRGQQNGWNGSLLNSLGICYHKIGPIKSGQWRPTPTILMLTSQKYRVYHELIHGFLQRGALHWWLHGIWCTLFHSGVGCPLSFRAHLTMCLQTEI